MSPGLAKVVEALLEYILTGEITGAVRSISTDELSVVMVTAWVGAFPSKSVYVILNVTVPEGFDGTIALDSIV